MIGLTLMCCAGPLSAQTADADATSPYDGVTWARDQGPGPESVPKSSVDTGDQSASGLFHQDGGVISDGEERSAGILRDSASFPVALIWGVFGGFIGAALFVKGQRRLLKTGRLRKGDEGSKGPLQANQEAVLKALQDLEVMATRWKEAGIQSLTPAGTAQEPEMAGNPIAESRPVRESRPVTESRPIRQPVLRPPSLGFAHDPEPLPTGRRLDNRPTRRPVLGIKEQVQQLVQQGEGIEQIARRLRISRESVRLFFQSDAEFPDPKSRKVMNGEKIESRAALHQRIPPNIIKEKGLQNGR
ncbi:MAG: hypothetical protein KJ970_14670 [Candidatus Eisenbacteria bacterium]|uniref:Uncharacterized protein n=1 Tax=Eiseniibacteriota bacterium TaxID=2212470 RepID=A0A948RYW8_UNCEI|nr:hypothetical protein [Candidatus Eisenbacteria bacterium]